VIGGGCKMLNHEVDLVTDMMHQCQW